jgi:hypothetical protein
VPCGLGLAFFATNSWRRDVELGIRWGLACTALFLASLAVLLIRNTPTPFLYFQF